MALQVKSQPDNLPTIGIAKPQVQPSIKVAPLPTQPSIGIAPVKQQPNITVQPVANQPKIASIGTAENQTPYTPPKPKLSMVEFAQSIKQKYPAYANKDDMQLAQAMLAKYPQYADKVDVPVTPESDFGRITRVSQESAQPFLPATEADLSPDNFGEFLKSVGKTIVNLPSSAYNLAKGVANAGINVFNPNEDQNTLANIGRLAAGAVEATPGLRAISKNNPEEKAKNKAVFDATVQSILDAYGSPEKAGASAVNDPFKVGSDIFSVLYGGAELANKTGLITPATMDAIDTGIAKTGQIVTKPVAKVASAAADAAGATTKFGVSQITGLSPKTVSTIAETPEAFSPSAIANTDRATVGQKVYSAIQTRLDDLSETGKGYQAVRQAAGEVAIPEGALQEVLNKYGIDVKDGKVVTTKESIPLSAGDKTALQSFVDTFGQETNLSNNAFLNARTELSNMAKYDATKTGASQTLSRELRAVYDKFGKEQVNGLAELDAKYAPERKLLDKIKKDYLTSDGGFKDGALNKLANLTGKGKDAVLGRLEKVVPGITKDINILKAVEDIELAQGQKVGAYLRGAAGGFAVSGGNPLVAIGTAIVSNPAIAVQLIRAYGAAIDVSKTLINSVVTKIQSGLTLNAEEKQLLQSSIKAAAEKTMNKLNDNVGLSVKNVGGKIKTDKAVPQKLEYFKPNKNKPIQVNRFTDNKPYPTFIVRKKP